MINKIHNENCIDTMAKLGENSVDLTVTSPPYGDLRTYNGYSFPFEDIAKSLYKVTKPGGVVAWVVGYETKNGAKLLDPLKQAIYFSEQCGFNLYDQLIYEKSSFSFPDKTRYYNVWEHIFLFSKGKIKTFNPIEDRPVKYQQSRGRATQRQRDGSLKDTGRGIIKYKKVSRRFNIWRYSTGYGNSTRDKIAYKHPAIFPEKLAEDIILSWTNKGDVVYDPMSGSGTTLKIAKKLERQWVGSEISEEYCKIIKQRMKVEGEKV
jgi:site-specific DNA-methyltransferase (adenine-specific)